jgi:demethylmenaquinone methyltransferase/2-methoxy-6-polyprenyl-1,4-benzoquinol methylase
MTFSLKIRDHLDDPAAKRRYNEALFEEVAPRYDFVTKALSLGRDGAWKREMVDALPALPGPVCVDLACGTGDVAFLLAEKFPDGDIVATDLTPAMLDLARQRAPCANVRFVQCDMSATGLPGASADIVTGSYALRNAPDLRVALSEIHRILKPGGTAAFLDFSKPSAYFGQRVTHALLKAWGGFWGLLLHGTPEVYAYIAESLRHFPDRDELRKLLTELGFTSIQSRRFYFGIVELICFKSAGGTGSAGPQSDGQRPSLQTLSISQ